MKKLIVTCALTASVALIAYGAASLASFEKLGVTDPFATVSSLTQVIILDAEQVKAQDYPQVVIAQPDASLEEYMASEGYVELEDERMGAIRVFSTGPNGDFLKYVEHTVNEHYSLWIWRE